MRAHTETVLLVLWAVGVLRPAGVARGQADCPIPGAALRPELESPYQLVLSHQAADVQLGYVPGVVYQGLKQDWSWFWGHALITAEKMGTGLSLEVGVIQGQVPIMPGWVMRRSGNGSAARMYVLRAVTVDDDNTAVNLSLPGPDYVRCSTPGLGSPTASATSGQPDAIAGAATSSAPVLTNWTAPYLPDPGCIDFIAYIQESNGTWFSASNRICERKGCFRYLTSSNGVLTSGSSDRYENNVDCVTLLSVPTQMVIHLQFTKFDLEPFRDDTDGCFDYVSVGSREDDNSSRRLCGQFSHTQLTNLSFISDGSYVVVKFVTDSKITRSGFSAIFYSLPVSGCDMFLNSSSGNLKSLGSGGEYFPNLNCTYTIQAPRSHRITLTFTQFNLQVEDGADVCVDYVAIETSLEEGGRRDVFCGNTHRPTVTSSLNWLRLTFHSDFRLQGRGFRAVYTTYESCNNATYVAENGTLTSMGFPQPYLNNQLCYIILTAPRDGDVIELQFDLLQTQVNTTSYLQDADCYMDYVEVYDGAAAHRLCGDWRRKLDLLHFRSRGSTMVVKFATDASGTGLGYVARWLSVRNESAIVECSQGWTAHGRACYRVEKGPRTWREAREHCELLGAQLASVRSAQVEDFLQELIEQSLNGSQHAVVWIGANDQEYEADFYWPDGSRVIYTDWFPGWPQYGAYNRQPSDDGLGGQDCVELRASFAFPSKGMGLTPTLYWNDRACDASNSYVCEQVKPGGLVPLTMWPLPGCVASLYVNDHRPAGLYTSPGYPSYYDDHTDCNATITAPIGYVIQLEFLYFHLEDSDSCSYDALTISSTGQYHTDSIAVRCGNWNDRLRLLHYVSLSHKLHLRFVSDHSHTYAGFKVRYSLANASLLCPSAQWRHQAGRCYSLHTSPSDWMHAQQTCRMYGAQVVLGKDVATLDVISAHVRPTERSTFWVDAIWNITKSNWTRAKGSYIDTDLVGALTPGRVGRNVETCLALVVSHQAIHYVMADCKTSYPTICWQDVTGERPWLELQVTSNETLTSPGYPSLPYPSNIQVRWYVAGRKGELLVLSVPFIDLEYHPGCLYDYLLIADPATGMQTRFCGQRTGLSHSVSSNLATVELVSDYRVTGGGFSATWSTFPASSSHNRSITLGDNNTITSGLLQSLNYPTSHLNDLGYWVTIEGGSSEWYRVWLEVLDLGLGSSSVHRGQQQQQGDACADRLTLYTDRAQLEPHMLCGSPSSEQLINYKYLSRHGYAAVHFTTDGEDNGRGYQLAYTLVPLEEFNYSATLAVDYNVSGELLPPNWPHPYPAHLDYTVTVQAPLGHVIQLTVTHLDLLSNSSSCLMDDHLDVTDPYRLHDQLLRRMCGQTSGGLTLTSYFHYLQVRLVSGGWEREGSSVDGYTLKYIVLQDPEFVNKSLTDMVVPLGSCDPSPCQNGGKCETRDGVSTCRCAGPYTGLVCSWTHCDRKPCKNVGTCVNVNGGYNCSCRLGYGGATCGVDLNHCRRTRCSKNGVCMVRANGDIDCVCEYNYKGSMCEIMKGPQMKSGTRLVEEPFWIGIIVVIGVLTLTGFLVLLRRKCLKHVEVDCCCCTHTSEADTAKSDKMSLSNETGSNSMYNGYHDYMSEPYSRTPQLSAGPSQTSTPTRHLSEVPTIRVYRDDDMDVGPMYTIEGRSHSIDAAAAVFVPHTAEIINATSTFSDYHNPCTLSAIHEEDPSTTHNVVQETPAMHTSEDDEDSIVSSEAGRVAFIHRDAEGTALEAPGETTIRHSTSCSQATPRLESSRQSPPGDLEKDISRSSSWTLSVDDGWLREATTNFHCWSSMDEDKHQMVKDGMLYKPDNDTESVCRKSIRRTVEVSGAKTEAKKAESQVAHRHVNSAKRREQFVSAVRQARNQNAPSNRPSSYSGQSGKSADCHSSCSCCTITSYDSDSRLPHHRSAPRLSITSPPRDFNSHFSQSTDIVSDPECASCRSKICSRCSQNSDEITADSCGRRHRSRYHGSNLGHRHRKTHGSSKSLNELRSSHQHHHRGTEYRPHHIPTRATQYWSVSIDIPDNDDDNVGRDPLSRHSSCKSSHSSYTGISSKRDRHGHRGHSESRRHKHRSSRPSSTSRRHRHHRSTHSLNEPYCDGDRSTGLDGLNAPFRKSSRRSKSAHNLDDYSQGERQQNSHLSHHRKVRDCKHHHHSPNKLREHKKLAPTLSDPASSPRHKMNQKLKGTHSLRRNDSRKSRSGDSIGRRSKSTSRGINSLDSEQEDTAPGNNGENNHRPYRQCGIRPSFQGSVNYPVVSTSLEFDSAKGTSLMNSIDYLKVPSFESTIPSEPDSFGGTSPEALSSTSGVSSSDLRQHSSDETDHSHMRKSRSQDVLLSGTTPSGSRLTLDIDTPTKEDIFGADLFGRRQHPLSKFYLGDAELYPGGQEQLQEPQGERQVGDAFVVSTYKNPLHDSAYQSKDHSTEKNASKPGSNVVSPTLRNGRTFSDIYYHTNTNFSFNGNDEKRITNQLELAARKLAALSHAECSSSVEDTQESEDAASIVENTTLSRPCVSDGVKLMKGRKMWPSRILSIIMDEGESDLSDHGPDMQQRSKTQDQSPLTELHPNYSGSNSPRIARSLLTPDFQRKRPRSAPDTRSAPCPIQVTLSPDLAHRRGARLLLERRRNGGMCPPQVEHLDVRRIISGNDSDTGNSNSSAVSVISHAYTPDTVIEAFTVQSDEEGSQQTVRVTAIAAQKDDNTTHNNNSSPALCGTGRSTLDSPWDTNRALPQTTAGSIDIVHGVVSGASPPTSVERGHYIQKTGSTSDTESNGSQTTEVTDSGYELPHEDTSHGTPHNMHCLHHENIQGVDHMHTLAPDSSSELELHDLNRQNTMYLSHMGNLRIDVISEV